MGIVINKTKTRRPAVMSEQVIEIRHLQACVQLPIRTVSELNQRGHWRQHQARKDAQKFAIRLVFPRPLLDAGLIGGSVIRREEKMRAVTAHFLAVPRLRVRFIRIGRRSLDLGDNLPSAFKYIRDALVRTIGLDDRDPRFVWEYEQIKRDEVGIQIIVEAA